MLRLLKKCTRLVKKTPAPSHERRRRSRHPYQPLLQVLEDRTLPATVFWTNPAGGEWAVPSNWSTGALPGALDDVIIDVPENVTITHLTGTDVVRSLTSLESILFLGGSLSLVTTSSIQNSLILTDGTLTGAGDLTLEGQLFWTGGTMSGTGRTLAHGGMTISGSGMKTLDGRTLDNIANAIWSGTGEIGAVNGAILNNLGGATFDVRNDATLQFNGGAEATFNNAGTVRKSDGMGSTSLSLRSIIAERWK